jgi:signal peptidase
VRLAATFLVWLAFGALAGVVGMVTLPRLVGVTPFTILSGSMRPKFQVGDVVLDRKVSPVSARPGDVVTFHDNTRGGELVTHRVKRMWRSGPAVSFITQGDANTGVEHWAVPADGTIGQVMMHVPKVGYGLQWAHSKQGRLGLIAIPAALLLVIELGGLGSLKRRREPEGSPA